MFGTFVVSVRGVLPAYAGMIRRGASSQMFSARAPRVCGDDPYRNRYNTAYTMCSPRMRG